MNDPALSVLGRKAIDAWLRCSLREQYGGVVTEPVPQEWIDLVEGISDPPPRDRYVGSPHAIPGKLGTATQLMSNYPAVAPERRRAPNRFPVLSR